MDIEYQIELIKELGLWGYLQAHPINPITIIVGMIVIGIIVLFVNSSVKKRKAKQFLLENPGAALMTLHKKRNRNTDYADNIRIITLNGKKSHWFFVRPTIPAIYLKPGENEIILYSEWARGGTHIKMYKSGVISMKVSVITDGHYSLEYYIPENKYIFEQFSSLKDSTRLKEY